MAKKIEEKEEESMSYSLKVSKDGNYEVTKVIWEGQPIFNSKRALEVAEEKAKEKFHKSQGSECPICKGKGETKIVELKKKDGVSSEEIFETECFACDGQGTFKDDVQKMQNLIHECVWCECESSSGEILSFPAKDGREVFGNDTYLCINCGMVRQFG